MGAGWDQSLVNSKDGFCFRFAHRSEEIMTPARSLPVIFATILGIAIGILLGAGTGGSSIFFKLYRK